MDITLDFLICFQLVDGSITSSLQVHSGHPFTQCGISWPFGIAYVCGLMAEKLLNLFSSMIVFCVHTVRLSPFLLPAFLSVLNLSVFTEDEDVFVSYTLDQIIC